jgi:putative endonuclease
MLRSAEASPHRWRAKATGILRFAQNDRRPSTRVMLRSAEASHSPEIPGASFMKQYYVYILTSNSGTFYTGMTNDLQRRVGQHKQKLIPGFTSRYNVNRLVYFEVFNEPQQAIAREKQIKGWVRRKKIALIEEENPTWRDLSQDWD